MKFKKFFIILIILLLAIISASIAVDINMGNNNFSEIIDIGNYVCLKNSNNLIYHLYAIVTHIGPSNMGGHFIAFCKSPIDNKWYKYNDAMVDYVGNFYNDIVNFGVPYILFYESQNL